MTVTNSTANSGRKPRWWIDLVVALGFVRLAREAALHGKPETADYCRDKADAAYARAEDICRKVQEAEK